MYVCPSVCLYIPGRGFCFLVVSVDDFVLGHEDPALGARRDQLARLGHAAQQALKEGEREREGE
jgi:hypothetical protein